MLLHRYPSLEHSKIFSLLLRESITIRTARTLLAEGEPTDAYTLTANLQSTLGKAVNAQASRQLVAFEVVKGLLRMDADQPNTIQPAACTTTKEELTIALLLSGYPPESTNGYALRSQAIVMALRRQGIRVVLVIRDSRDSMVFPPNPEDSTPIYRLPRVSNLSAVDQFINDLHRVASVVVENECALIHTTTNFELGGLGASAAKLCGIPWIYELRGELHETWASRRQETNARASEYYRRARLSEHLLAKSADGVVTLSHVSARHSQTDLAANGIVLPNGYFHDELSQPHSKETARKQLGISCDRLFGSVSSVVDYEGFQVAISALHVLPQNWKFLLVGDGPALGRLKEYAQQEGVADRVIFAGRQPSNSIAIWYSCIDVFVLPRLDYAVCQRVTPIKAMLAQALSIPVVASDLEALREVTQNVEYYVEPGNAKALAKGIEIQFRRSFKPKLESRDWNELVKPLLSLYLHVLKK